MRGYTRRSNAAALLFKNPEVFGYDAKFSSVDST
jgi:hypothetical protein